MSDTTINRKKLVIPALGGIYEALSPYSWLLIRVAAGAMLIPHGYAKLFGGQVDGLIGFLGQLGFVAPAFWGWLVALLEFFGGIMLVAGFLTRPIAAMVVGFMAVAAFGVHLGNGFYWTDGGFEYPLFWGIVALAIVIRGGGGYSVDARLSREI